MSEELRALALAHGVDPTYIDTPDAVCACGHRRDDHGDGVMHTSCCADFVCECTVFAPGAVLSACGRYRYELRRVWDPTGPILEFIMLNPSTADASVDDPTIRRIAGSEKKPGFARKWGYGGIVVRNLFCLGTNAGGSPKHPLYVPADRTPIRWAPPHPQMSR